LSRTLVNIASQNAGTVAVVFDMMDKSAAPISDVLDTGA